MTMPKSVNTQPSGIDLPRFSELDAEGEVIAGIAKEMRVRALRYCRSHLPDHEGVVTPLEVVWGDDAYRTLSDFPAGNETLGIITTSTRGKREGFICTAWLTRGVDLCGMAVRVKFRTRKESEHLARQIGDWYCW
jgi:hypothetical protein